MAEPIEIAEIALQLTSPNSAIRHKGLKSLKLVLNLTPHSSFRRIAAGLYHFYRLSDGLNEQLADRAALCGLLDLIKCEDKLKWLETFIGIAIELWPETDSGHREKYLKLIREWFLTGYGWLNGLTEYKKIWIRWNHFLFDSILFHPEGQLTSDSARASIPQCDCRLFGPQRAQNFFEGASAV
jgi:hypothetical protein